MEKKPGSKEWAAARSAFEAGQEFAELAKGLGVSRQAVRQRAAREGWARLPPGPDDAGWREAAAAVLSQPVAALAGVAPGELLESVREAVLRRQQAEVSRVRGLFSRALDELEAGQVVAGRDVEVCAKVLTALHRAEVAAFGLGGEESGHGVMTVTIRRESVPFHEGL